MATNYTCKSFWDNNHEFKVLQTPAANIQLLSVYKNKACQTVQGSGNYGMNASFFNSNGNKAILNIALQNGVSVGTGEFVTSPDKGMMKDGLVNLVGSSAITWNTVALDCKSNITYSTDPGIPSGPNTWVQGGIGLYLCDRNWQDKYLTERSAEKYPLIEAAARTGILINKSTKDVYLFACRGPSTVSELRSAMMRYANLTEGSSAGSWRAIMLDGGRSTQLYSGEGSVVFPTVRKVPQIIALKNKT